MTTYTTIADTEIDTDSPVTESLMTRIRDNPIAITEGSTGAPKIQNAALATDSVRAAQIQADAVGSSEIAANAVRFSSEIYNTASTGSWVVIAFGTQTVPIGVYLIHTTMYGSIEIRADGVNWGTFIDTTIDDVQIISDGSNVRVKNNSASSETYEYRKIFS